MTRQPVHTPDAPLTGSFLSQGLRLGSLVQVSGQGGTSPDDESPPDVATQTERALKRIETILGADGLGFDDVLMFRVYLAQRSSWDEMNRSYEEAVQRRLSGAGMPARTTVITGLPFEDMHVEIDALAVSGE